MRVLTAAVLVPAVLAIIFYAPLWLMTLIIAVIVILALREFFQLAAKAGVAGYPAVAMAIAMFLLLEQWLAVTSSITNEVHWSLPTGNYPDLGGSFIGFLLVLSLWSLVTRGSLRERFAAIASTSLAVLAIALPLSFLVPLADSQTGVLIRLMHRAMASDVSAVSFLGDPPPWLLLFTLLIVWVGDTVAYFVGRAIGRHKLAPEISPGKTWEGAMGNIAGALLVGWLFARSGMHLPTLLSAAVVGSIAGQIGDLFESMYKRAAGVKDSGTLLPGHGGVLDRIDALIFAAPAVWAYFTYVVR